VHLSNDKPNLQNDCAWVSYSIQSPKKLISGRRYDFEVLYLFESIGGKNWRFHSNRCYLGRQNYYDFGFEENRQLSAENW
jgi:hypothetical protein